MHPRQLLRGRHTPNPNPNPKPKPNPNPNPNPEQELVRQGLREAARLQVSFVDCARYPVP
jgi:hypothetical protein